MLPEQQKRDSIDKGWCRVSLMGHYEEIDATAGRAGSLEVPSMLLLAIAPFYGEQPAGIGARFRWRIREGNLSLGYKLERPYEVEQRVLDGIAERLRGAAGFERVYKGTPR